MKWFGRPLLGLLFFFFLMEMPQLSGGLIENIVFSDKNYASNIEVHGWIVTEAQLQEVFNRLEDPVQLTYGKLNEEYSYFLIRLKNLEPYRAWGSLVVQSPGIGEVTVGVMGVEPRLARPEYYTIPIGKAGFPRAQYEEKPTFCFKWKKLYVK